MTKKATHKTHTTRALQAAGIKVPLHVAEARAGLLPSEETEGRPVVTFRLTYREYDTILAALRFWQANRDGVCSETGKPNADDYAEISEAHGAALDDKQIDQFIERVQFDGKPLPIMVMEGGLIQEALYPVPDGEGNPFTSAEYDLFDYDIFDGCDDATIVGHWNMLSDDAKAYFRKHVSDAWVPVRKAIAREKRRARKAMKKGGAK